MSGGGVFRNLNDLAKGALIRAAASTQTLEWQALLINHTQDKNGSSPSSHP
jgi:hypothetical protein